MWGHYLNTRSIVQVTGGIYMENILNKNVLVKVSFSFSKIQKNSLINLGKTLVINDWKWTNIKSSKGR